MNVSSSPSSRARVGAALADVEGRLAPIARALGFEVLTVEWLGGRRGTLRVYVDHPDGVRIDDCARLSRLFGQELEAAELESTDIGALLGAGYDLEVSSPGLDRPLAKRSHFERFVGHRARIRVHEPLADFPGRRNFVGRIAGVEDAADGASVVLDLEEPAGTPIPIPLAAIRKAHLIYED